MRTKEQIIDILASRKISKQLEASTWVDLVESLQSGSPGQRDKLVKMIAQQRSKDVGDILHMALLKNAEQRARAEVEAMLVDDSLTLAELDELI